MTLNYVLLQHLLPNCQSYDYSLMYMYLITSSLISPSVPLESVYLTFLQFTLYHRKKCNLSFFFWDLVFGHGHVLYCKFWICWVGVNTKFTIWHMTNVKTFTLNIKVIPGVKGQIRWRHLSFISILTSVNILKLYFIKNSMINFYYFYIYW